MHDRCKSEYNDNCDEYEDVDVLNEKRNNGNKRFANSDSNEGAGLSSNKNMIYNSSDNTPDNQLKQCTKLDHVNDMNRPISIIVCYNMSLNFYFLTRNYNYEMIQALRQYLHVFDCVRGGCKNVCCLFAFSQYCCPNIYRSNTMIITTR